MSIINKSIKSKTMWASLATAIIGAVIANMPLVREHIEPKFYGYMFMALSVIMAVLRVYTTTSLDEK